MTDLPRYWYTVVSALPDPETEERVNVALIVGGDRWAKVDYVEQLPKLSCLVTDADLRLFRAAITGLERRVHSPEDLYAAAAQLGPHFHLAEPRELFQAPEGRVLRLIRNRFLRLPSEGRASGKRRSVQRAATHRLDRALQEGLPIAAMIEKNATAEKLYPQIELNRIFTAPVPRLNRAIRIGDVDVLIGGVVVEHEDPLGAARDATARISQAFWQYHRAKDTIREATGREIRTLGVVLNGTGGQRPEVRSAKEYVLHLWKDDADEIFAPARREDEKYLVEKVQEMVPEVG